MNREVGEKKVVMKNITINIPDVYDEVIKKLIKMKIIPSRSEAVRTAIRGFLSKESENKELYEEIIQLK